MQLAETFIRRPVLSSMVSLAFILVGVIGYTRLPVREFPDADPPIVSVTVILPGANPQVIESAVTDVLEEELSSLEGLRTMTSASQEQISTITLEFTLDREQVAGQGLDVFIELAQERDHESRAQRERMTAFTSPSRRRRARTLPTCRRWPSGRRP